MSTDETPPPLTRNSANGSTPPAAHTGVRFSAVVWTGVAVVVLSFVASFLGASLAKSGNAAEPVPTTSMPSTAEYASALEEILPAGSAVRAGTGVPETGKGYEGDVYIDISTSDVYVFRDGEWTLAGNIRESAAENLTGETGAEGAAGAPGAAGAAGSSGAAGAAGTPGTQLALGTGAPEATTCAADGDVYIDTVTLQFYECTDSTWTLFGPSPSPTDGPATTPTP